MLSVITPVYDPTIRLYKAIILQVSRMLFLRFCELKMPIKIVFNIRPTTMRLEYQPSQKNRLVTPIATARA